MRRLGYLFERFPSFTQTFCAREVAAMRALGFTGPVYAIRRPAEEPVAQNFPETGEVVLLPESFSPMIESDAQFRRAARRRQEELRKLWGDESEKRRIYEALWLERACAASGATHLHAHFAGVAARTAFWLSRLGRAGFSLTAHANDIFRDEPPERLRQIFSSATFVATVSEFSRRQLEERFPEAHGKIFCVYNGMDTGAMPQRAVEPDAPPLILSVGRAIPKKGFEDLIAACALLGGSSFQCRIIGGGPLEEALRGRVAAAGLGDKLRVEGPMPERDIFALLSRSTAFVLPCVAADDGAMDNLPTVIMEAMAAGLPVVSTRLAGIPEMVEDGRTGFLVEPRQPAALAEKIRWLLDHPAEARAMGEAGREKCRRTFDVSVTSRQLAGLMNDHGISL
ncbi:MAG: glycosyltransferase family 4 protein [Terrimicrobiaceae bacterium]|nr:glycosyltransferase family 4 protein [Terrimicrobiaceae bacterium]